MDSFEEDMTLASFGFSYENPGLKAEKESGVIEIFDSLSRMVENFGKTVSWKVHRILEIVQKN